MGWVLRSPHSTTSRLDTIAALRSSSSSTILFFDSIDSAIQEHELVFLWRDLPADARRLVLENAQSVKRAFKDKVKP
mgnify:CR=1 FL=1